jgi:hypothetical protein
MDLTDLTHVDGSERPTDTAGQGKTQNTDIARTERLLRAVVDTETDLRKRIAVADRHTKIWQTAVALGAAIAAGLSGFVAGSKISSETVGILIAVLIAIGGVLGNVSNIWRSMEIAKDRHDRYAMCKALHAEIEDKLHHARDMDQNKPIAIAVFLEPFNIDAEHRLSTISDLVNLAPASPGAIPRENPRVVGDRQA